MAPKASRDSQGGDCGFESRTGHPISTWRAVGSEDPSRASWLTAGRASMMCARGGFAHAAACLVAAHRTGRSQAPCRAGSDGGRPVQEGHRHQLEEVWLVAHQEMACVGGDAELRGPDRAAHGDLLLRLPKLSPSPATRHRSFDSGELVEREIGLGAPERAHLPEQRFPVDRARGRGRAAAPAASPRSDGAFRSARASSCPRAPACARRCRAGQDQGADPIRPTQGEGDQGDGAVAEAAEVRVGDLSYVE